MASKNPPHPNPLPRGEEPNSSASNDWFVDSSIGTHRVRSSVPRKDPYIVDFRYMQSNEGNQKEDSLSPGEREPNSSASHPGLMGSSQYATSCVFLPMNSPYVVDFGYTQSNQGNHEKAPSPLRERVGVRGDSVENSPSPQPGGVWGRR